MPTGLTYSVALDGIDGQVVTVEADVHNGIPGYSIAGLPDSVVSEARDRCRAAIVNSDQTWPDRRITVAMYPADVRKVGSHYDLAIALALLVATGKAPGATLRRTAVFGELALDGNVRDVPGILPATVAAVEAGLDKMIVPLGNVAEATLVGGIEVAGVSSLRAALAMLRGDPPPDDPPAAAYGAKSSRGLRGRVIGDGSDLRDVRGQASARWCLEVAAAGGHHLSLEGPPGAGKTMLAERFPALLPDLELGAAIEVSKIHSVAGWLSRDQPLVIRPPFLAPHHNDTVPSVVGGGTRVIRPGAISLAHRGVLFLDEAPEFKPSVHDALRQPLEGGEISIRRAEGAARFPARFQLILAANPCPCGQGYGKASECECSAQHQRAYKARISGPVRDRIDILHTVLPVTRVDMRQPVPDEAATAAVAARVGAARSRQSARYDGLRYATNGQVESYDFRRLCPIDEDVSRPIEEAVGDGKLTQRGADRVARIAWTLADLDGCDAPRTTHVREALHLRTNGLLGDDTRAGRVA